MSAWEQFQDCRDGLGRDRVGAHGLGLFLDGNWIGLHVPPGEVATLSVVEAYVLPQHLAAGLWEVARRAGIGPLAEGVHYRQGHDLLDLNGRESQVHVSAVLGEVLLSVVGPAQSPHPSGRGRVGVQRPVCVRDGRVPAAAGGPVMTGGKSGELPYLVVAARAEAQTCTVDVRLGRHTIELSCSSTPGKPVELSAVNAHLLEAALNTLAQHDRNRRRS